MISMTSGAGLVQRTENILYREYKITASRSSRSNTNEIATFIKLCLYGDFAASITGFLNASASDFDLGHLGLRC